MIFEEGEADCEDEGAEDISVLFIGNSICIHGIVDIWQGEWGMAATDREHDYVHVAVDLLSETYDVDYVACSAYDSWEIPIIEREETMKIYDVFLSRELDYIVLQLGENVTYTDGLEEDYGELFEYLTGNSDAELIVVGNFWKNEEVENAKKLEAEKRQIPYVDLSDMWGEEEYYAGIGTQVYDQSGNLYPIDNEGVAKHPGDAGMEEIGKRIADKIKKR